ncbi:MAG: C10 family peptidase [Paludibacteraceae bacterium]|nr:C10 family peptidase [Paludibacteraceae bacterium]
MRITLPDDVISYYEENYGAEAGAAFQSALYVYSKLYPENYEQFIHYQFDVSMEFYTLNTVRNICSDFPPGNDNDTLMYVINFSNNNGYILITDSLNILAVSDQSNIPLSDFTADITEERFNSRPPKWTIIGSINDKMISKAEYHRVFGHAVLFQEPADSFFFNYYDTIDLGPFVKMKLHQEDPYNSFCPTNSANQHAVAGCVPIALTYLFSANNTPELRDSGYLYSWEEIVDDCVYHDSIGDRNHYNIDNYPKLQTLCKIIAKIGQSIGVNYGDTLSTCIIDNSDANSVTVYLRQHGYPNATLKDIATSQYKNMLYNKKTIFACGSALNHLDSTTMGGHAWVFDGIFSYDFNLYSYHNNRLYLVIGCHYEIIHCNFGNDIDNNVWCSPEIFLRNTNAQYHYRENQFNLYDIKVYEY